MRSSAAFLFVVSACCAAFACSAAKTSSFDEPALEDAGTFEDPGGGSLSSDPNLPGNTCIDSTKNLAACEKCCEVDEQKEGYEVFKQAINACACQPSKCGGACVADICATPPLKPPAISACTTCLGYITTGEPLPEGNTFGGGASPDLGANDCRAYGAEICKKSVACQRTEQCKNACRARAKDAGTL